MATEDSRQNEDIRRLAKLIRGIEVAMLTTATPDGTLRSRPMVTQKAEFDGDLWFFTRAGSDKTHEIGKDQHVNVSYVDREAGHYISVSGTARLLRDPAKAKQLWTPAHKAWFPVGPEDPNLMLLKIDVHQAEYWDEPSSRMVQLMGLMKAVATGRRYTPGESEKINLETYPATKTAPPRGEDLPKSEGSNYSRAVPPEKVRPKGS